MTGTIWESPRSNRKFSAAHLGLALLIGAVAGGAATFAIDVSLPTARISEPAVEAAPRATVVANDVHAAATEQYAGWYLRSPIGAGARSTLERMRSLTDTAWTHGATRWSRPAATCG